MKNHRCRITADLDKTFLSVAKARTDAVILWLYKYNGITVNEKKVRRSSGKKGCHVVLWTDNHINRQQFFFIRLVLGDDIKRVKLDMLRKKPKQFLFYKKVYLKPRQKHLNSQKNSK